MSAKNAAVEDIKKLGKSLKGLIALAEDLEKIGSLESYEEELTHRVETLQSLTNDADAKYKEAKDKLDAAGDEARSVIQNAKAAAAEMVKQAEAEAKLTAAEIIKQAKLKEDKIILDIEQKRKVLMEDVSSMVSDLADMKREKALVEEKLSVMKAEIDKIKKFLS